MDYAAVVSIELLYAVAVLVLISAGLFGLISQTVTLLSTPAVGEIALLIVAVVLLRLLPTGITGRFFRGHV